MRVFLLCSLPLIRCAPNLNCSVLLYKRCYCYEMVWKLLRCSPVMILEDKHRQQWVCFELWTFLASYVLQLINHTSFVAGKYFISMTEKRNCLLPANNLAQLSCCSPSGRTHSSSVREQASMSSPFTARWRESQFSAAGAIHRESLTILWALEVRRWRCDVKERV